MLKLGNDAVTVNVKSIVYDDDGHRNQIYWLTAIGSRVALQSVFASLVNRHSVVLAVGAEERRRYEIGPRDNHMRVPDSGSIHATYKKLQSGLSAMAMYSSMAMNSGENSGGGPAVLLCREDEDQIGALFHFLNSRVRIPLCEDWSDWVWRAVSKSEGSMRQLTGCGLVGFFLRIDECEDEIRKAIGPAIKKGIIKR